MRRVLAVLLALTFAGCAAGHDAKPEAADDAPLAEPDVNQTVGAVFGVVVDDEDKPVAKAQVGVEGPLGLTGANTTSNGEFSFPDLAPGAYRLFAQKIGFDAFTTTVAVTAGEVTRVEVRLRPTMVGPDFPVAAAMTGLRTHGGWFQVPYSEAAAALPDGFDPKPHVLLEPNGVTAEYQIYSTSYEDLVVDGESLGPGLWTFEVLSVVPPEEHGGVQHTVEFFVFASYASDARVADLLTAWGVPTTVAELTSEPGGVAADTFHTMSTVETEGVSYRMMTTGGQDQGSALTGGAIDVRVFAVADEVTNYVLFDISDAAYSLSAASNLEGDGFAFPPPAPAGLGYLQWGDQATQTMRFEPL